MRRFKQLLDNINLSYLAHNFQNAKQGTFKKEMEHTFSYQGRSIFVVFKVYGENKESHFELKDLNIIEVELWINDNKQYNLKGVDYLTIELTLIEKIKDLL